MSNKKSNIFGFMLVVIFSLLATVYFAYHWVNLLFGDNSIQVYNSLKHKKEYLEDEISSGALYLCGLGTENNGQGNIKYSIGEFNTRIRYDDS